MLLVLLLWVAAIALFINRWGKIRMLEPCLPYKLATLGEGPMAAQVGVKPVFIHLSYSSQRCSDILIESVWLASCDMR